MALGANSVGSTLLDWHSLNLTGDVWIYSPGKNYVNHEIVPDSKQSFFQMYAPETMSHV